MPFLHKPKKRIPWFKWAEEQTFRTGLRHAIFSPSGDRYKGEWLKGSRSGKGVELKTGGNQYEGDWLEDQQNGWGVQSQFIPDEKRFQLSYTGEHKNAKFHGFGYRHYSDGTFFEGEFKNHKREGYGRCWYVDKSFYEGYWQKDLYDGYGMFVQGNGNRYEGEWKKGKKNGWGKFYHLDSGQIQEGFWTDDTCTTSFMKDINYRQASKDPTPYPIPPIGLHPEAECLIFLNQAEKMLLQYNEGCQFHKFCYSRSINNHDNNKNKEVSAKN